MAVTIKVVSFELCTLRNNKMSSIYYVSYVLNGPEEGYSPLEKYLLNLVVTARKLKPYFKSYPINVLTLRKVLHIPDLSESSSKRALE